MTSNVYEQTLIHWTKLIEPFFTKSTRFVTVDTKQRFCTYIQSPPENPEEKYWVSNRTPMLIFRDNAINDYIHNYEPGSHRKADIRLKEYVDTKIKDKMPEHDILHKKSNA